MFQFEFGVNEKWENEQDLSYSFKTSFQIEKLKTIYDVTWEEHCVECAVPDCYSKCLLYQRRGDGACARFEYGIVKNSRFQGFSDGGDIRFKKWAKLEAELNKATPNLADNNEPLHLLLECFSPSQQDFLLILEYFILDEDRVRTSLFRHSILIKYGKNSYVIPCLDLRSFKIGGYFHLYPESSDPTKRIIFTWLHFVNYKEPFFLEKVKCVAWDLDNTLWNGIIGENGSVEPNAEAIILVKELDGRGVLQTIISKNDYSRAWSKVEELGLGKYFLYPAINWDPKSENITKVASELNISVRHIALIDDSAFEREEVRARLEEVRVYSNNEISRILSYPEFEHVFTKGSKERRSQYQMEISRKQFKEIAPSYIEFLKACQMELRIFKPRGIDDIERCHELVQRTNQLNLSFRRYSKEELIAFIAQPDILSFAMECNDKFGNYGIIGFCTVNISREATLVDFLISCRIAQKKVEQTFFWELLKFLSEKNKHSLDVRFRPTALNLPMLKVFEDLDLDFEEIGSEYQMTITSQNLGNRPDIMDVVFDI